MGGIHDFSHEEDSFGFCIVDEEEERLVELDIWGYRHGDGFQNRGPCGLCPFLVNGQHSPVQRLEGERTSVWSERRWGCPAPQPRPGARPRRRALPGGAPWPLSPPGPSFPSLALLSRQGTHSAVTCSRPLSLTHPAPLPLPDQPPHWPWEATQPLRRQIFFIFLLQKKNV